MNADTSLRGGDRPGIGYRLLIRTSPLRRPAVPHRAAN